MRAGNRTIYPTTDMSVLVKVTADDGTIGWGETYGIVAPEAVVAIVDDVLGPQVVGRDPRDAVAIQEDLYDLMRVRGHFGGFYVDAIAGIDIALWDLFGKIVGQPVAKLLGGHRTRLDSRVRLGLARRDARGQGGARARLRGPRLRRVQVRGGRLVRRHRGRDARAARGARPRGEADGRPALEVHARAKRSR